MKKGQAKITYGDGTVKLLTHLVADDGMTLTNGSNQFDCVDVPEEDVAFWSETVKPNEPNIEDKAEAYDILMGVSE